MGYIRERTTKKGKKFRAEIRINRQGYPNYSESKTFSNRKLAEIWINQREYELEQNPELLHGQEPNQKLTLSKAIDRYLNEVGENYGRTKVYCLRRVQKMPIAAVIITKLTPLDISSHATSRLQGSDDIGLPSIATSTLTHEMLHIRSVLQHAAVMWDVPVDLNMFDRVSSQLRKTRQMTKSRRRDRLPTNDELMSLTQSFAEFRISVNGNIPMGLVMWFAIYSCRRESEITRLRIADYDRDSRTLLVRDVKNPSGSKGNHKRFTVSDECAKLIELALSDKYRQMMEPLGYDPGLIFPINPKSISTRFKEKCRFLGIEDLRFHDLRHEGCTRLAEQGLTIPQIQKISLHESWSSLQRYVSVQHRSQVLTLSDVLPYL